MKSPKIVVLLKINACSFCIVLIFIKNIPKLKLEVSTSKLLSDLVILRFTLGI
jgi:hypothetical protein